MTTSTPRPAVPPAARPGRAAGGPFAVVPPGMLGELTRFCLVGGLSTLAYLLLVWVLRGAVGTQAANLVALLVTAVGNTAANRRLTFSVSGTRGLWRHHAQGLAAFALALGLTSGSLALLHAMTDPSAEAEMAVLVVANAAATLMRFLLLRSAFRRPV